MKMYEFTPAQKNFALLQSFFKGTSIATLCGIIIFDDLLERPALIDALKSVIKKHDALHLRFHCDKGKMMQYVADESVETNDNVFFMSFENEEEARKYALKEGKTVFDAEDAPMYRFTVFEIPDHTGIILSASHIVLDSWSYSVLAGDIFKTYSSITDTDVPAGDNGMGDSEKTDNVLKDRINIHCSPDDPCYMIFTSGSSGRPKGTVITHRNVINYSEVTEHGICGGIIKDEKSIVSVTDHVFDIFVTESLMALLDLKTIILADDNEAKSGKALGRLVRNTHSEVIQTTPTKMRSFMLDKNSLEFLSCFKKIILGGEKLPASLIKELKNHTCAKIFNVYGPAETTVWSSFTEADENDVTIGKPLTNTGIYILDENRELLPSDIMGEICISGEGVGNGYPADPALTAEKFIPDKFREGRMMYCTGDMGIMRADGNILFCGRRDSQIKLRGLRIDLTETEGAMCEFEGISQAVVVCREQNGVQKLFGYYTSSARIMKATLTACGYGQHSVNTIPLMTCAH